LRYDEALAAFLPGSCATPIFPAGAANGRVGLAAVLADGQMVGTSAAAGDERTAPAPPRAAPEHGGAARALWSVASVRRREQKRFIDLQDDVTADDLALAAREGYSSVELLKRYTTLGMGPDQGKTSNVLGLALLAEATGRSIAELGTTTFRAPYTPVTFG